MYGLHDGEVHARALRYIAGGGSGETPAAESSRRASEDIVHASSVPPVAMPFTYTTNLSEVRALVRQCARQAGLPESRANDLVIAVSEAAANTVRHARSSGTLDIWHNESEIVCEIRDEGVITNPLAGRRHPTAGAMAGHGLWLVHRLCDVVELTSGQGGTTVRMHMAIRAASGG